MGRILVFLPVILLLVFPGRLDYTAAFETANAPIHVLARSCDTIPGLNQQIKDLVTKQIGKTVARGECWDVAAMALNQTGAKWDKRYAFGRKIDPDKECVFPGDFIQFEGVKIKYSIGPRVYTETMDHHTAMVYEVKAKGSFVLAHQNTATSGRKVGLSDLDLKNIVKGTYQFYRPEL